jgi:hypothetical protein
MAGVPLIVMQDAENLVENPARNVAPLVAVVVLAIANHPLVHHAHLSHLVKSHVKNVALLVVPVHADVRKRNAICKLKYEDAQGDVRNHVRNRVRNHVRNRVRNHVRNHVRNNISGNIQGNIKNNTTVVYQNNNLTYMIMS